MDTNEEFLFNIVCALINHGDKLRMYSIKSFIWLFQENEKNSFHIKEMPGLVITQFLRNRRKKEEKEQNHKYIGAEMIIKGRRRNKRISKMVSIFSFFFISLKKCFKRSEKKE